MIGKVHRTAHWRHRSRSSCAWLTGALIALATLGSSSTAAAALRLYDKGLRWIGRSVFSPPSCTAPAGWTAQPLFTVPAPPGTAALCSYRWNTPWRPPTVAQIDDLMMVSRAVQMTEDVPVVVPQARGPWSAPEKAFFAGLRTSLLARVGNVSFLPAFPAVPPARVVVIDSAADAAHGQILPGEGSRHGDTLAHLIEDLVCLPAVPGTTRRCAAEVTTALALPWVSSGVDRPAGGHIGTLAELALAIQRATDLWMDQRDANAAPSRLILNLSLGWEHTRGVAECATSAARSLPVIAVQAALDHAARHGVLIIAAAGNQSGGPTPRTGMLCPGNYQSLPHPLDPSRSLLYAVSGLDASDRPLTSARAQGRAALAAYGLGGVSWQAPDLEPPALTGSSVATAVVSAVAALALAHRPLEDNDEVTRAIYDGGVLIQSTADACPVERSGCQEMRRASVCGALSKLDPSISCSPSGPGGWSSPILTAEVAALQSSIATPAALAPPTPLSHEPRSRKPSMQIEPWTFPQPISVTCPTCVVSNATTTALAQLWLPALGRALTTPMLIVIQDNGVRSGYALGSSLTEGSAYRFYLPTSSLPPNGAPIRSAYVSGLDLQGVYSVTEEIFVHR